MLKLFKKSADIGIIIPHKDRCKICSKKIMCQKMEEMCLSKQIHLGTNHHNKHKGGLLHAIHNRQRITDEPSGRDLTDRAVGKRCVSCARHTLPTVYRGEMGAGRGSARERQTGGSGDQRGRAYRADHQRTFEDNNQFKRSAAVL